MQARHEGATNYMTRQHEKKILQMKDRLTKLQENVLAEKARWQAKYNNLENQLASAKDRVYVEKVKCRTLIQKQIDETERVEMMLANYAHSLQEENQELRHELAVAIKEKQTAERTSHKSKRLAKQRLEKWHTEKHLRRIAEDYAAQQEKNQLQLQAIMHKYEEIFNNSQETKRELQKEWADEEAAHRRGGARRWPVWVVQLICELLVNGTAPSAIPANIQTMYEMLYGEKPKEVPSVRFVRNCRVVVEVIGETVVALKLALAESWKQLCGLTPQHGVRFLLQHW